MRKREAAVRDRRCSLGSLYLKMADLQNEGKPWEWHITETFKGLINLSIEGLKALLLINGGAAVAILAYLGNLAARTSVAHLPDVKNALLCFAGDVFATRSHLSSRILRSITSTTKSGRGT